MSKKAVIDLGTNTFHLLIVEMKKDGSFAEVFRKRIYVKLAEEGIKKIGNAPLNRAFEAMSFFSGQLKNHDCTTVKAYATAALRTASNGADFLQKVKTETGIEIQLIDGQKEAELIFSGVKKAVPFDKEYQLVMDIGGGSTEFIIGNQTETVWAKSFVAGVGVLYKEFHHSEPISFSEIKATEAYLEKIFQPLFEAIEMYKPKILTGSAGAFETIADLIPCQRVNKNFAIFEPKYLPGISNQILQSNLQERLNIKGMPAIRAEFMPVAMILIDFILKKTKIEKVYYSAFALKEGMLFDE